MRSVLGRIALTVALSLGATGALVAVQAPAFATTNTGCTPVVFPPGDAGSYCEAGPDQHRIAIECKAYNSYYSYWRYGSWEVAGRWSMASCWSSAEHIVSRAQQFMRLEHA